MALGADVAQLIVSLRLDDKGFSGRLNAAAGQLRAMDSGLSQMGRGAGQLGTGLLRLGERAALVAGAGLFAVTKWAMDTETAFAGVQKTVDETVTTSYEQLSEQIDKLAARKPQDWAELAQIGEFGGQLGVSADNLASFVDTVSDFLVAVPMMGLEEAAFGLQRIQVLTKAGDDALDNIASTVVELGNNFATTESAIIATSERFASQATLIGLSTQATLGLSTALTALGGEPQEAGTSMQRLFQRINLALAEGGEAAALFAKVSGQSAADFRKSWEDDAEGTLVRFLKGMGDSSLSAIEQTAILDDLGLADARLGKNVLNLANNMDITEAALKSANEEWKTNTALTEEAQKRYDTFASQLSVLKNNLMLAGVTIGNELLPVVKELTQEFVEFLNKPETQAGLRDFATNLAEGVRGVVAELKGTDFSGLLGGLKIAADAAKVAFDAFRALPQPIQQLAIAALVANKVSGGAIGLIAKGLGNLVLGSLKTIYAANVTVIGGGVVGGPGGIGGPVGGGRGGGGFLGGAWKLFPVLGAAAIGAEFGDEIAGFGTDLRRQIVGEKFPSIKLSDVVWPFGTKNTPTILPELFGGNGLLGGTPGSSIRGGASGSFTAPDSAFGMTHGKYIDEGKMETAIRKGVAKLPDSAMLSPLVDTATATLPPILTAIEATDSKASAQLQKSSDVLGAIRATQDPLRRIAGKNFSIVNKITVPLSVSVGVSETQYRTRSFTQTVGGYDNSAGI